MNTLQQKILIISSEFPPNVGGIGNHAYNLARALSGEGYDVTVIADLIAVSKQEQEDFMKQQSFNIYFLERKSLVINTYISRIAKAISLAGKADIVICSGKFSLWLATLLRLINFQKQLIAVVHGSELDIKSVWARHLTFSSLSKFNSIIPVSTYTEKFLPLSLPTRIKKFIIHNGINSDEYTTTLLQQLEGDPVLITVGNVTPRKGQENVIKALPVIKQLFGKTRYHIIGKPTTREKLQRRCKELDLNETVQFHGAVSRSELLSKLSSAKVKLMLSNHTDDGDFEGFGIAVLEANAFGVPAIGSRNSGIADAIVDNKTGILVDPKDPVQITRALETIMKDYAYFSLNAKDWASQHDWKIIVKEYINVFTVS